ncbi:MAG: NAD(+) diphosphatase [Lachnospiraceae bacterium]
MIQDIEPRHLVNQYEPKEPQKNDKIIIFRGNEILVKIVREVRTQDTEESAVNGEKMVGDYMTYGALADMSSKLGIDVPECRYIFTIGEEAFFLADMPKEHLDELTVLESSNHYGYYKMYDLRRMEPKEVVFAGSTAWHIYHWYHTSRFCGVCGSKTVHDFKERMVKCPECGNLVFPRLVPAVIVGLRDGDRLMMTKYAGRAYKRYALIAGFTEIGETVEETVAREVMEEVGVKVRNITYYKSQPWGFDSDLLLGYYCDLDGDSDIRMDENELSVAEWVDYKDIPDYHEGLSLTEEMMNTFKRERMAIHQNDAQNVPD